MTRLEGIETVLIVFSFCSPILFERMTRLEGIETQCHVDPMRYRKVRKNDPIRGD